MTRLAVVASGLVSAVGYNAPASLAALRAGISGVRGIGHRDRHSGAPLRCARVSLPQRGAGVDLLVDLLAPAVHECLMAAQPLRLGQIPLLIGVSAPDRPARPADLDTRLLAALCARLGGTAHPASQLYAADQIGAALALMQAQRLLASQRAGCVIVAGVDSFLDPKMLDAYNERRRLLTDLNVNGFLGGEAGAAVLVVAADADADVDVDADTDAPDLSGKAGGLRITGWGAAEESATIESTAPLRAQALTTAIKTALGAAARSMPEVDFRITDLSGEHYKFKEALFAAIRLDDQPRAQALPLWHPIEFIGEVGAAIGPCLLAWAAHAFEHGYAPGPVALCHLGSDAGGRAALVLEPARGRVGAFR